MPYRFHVVVVVPILALAGLAGCMNTRSGSGEELATAVIMAPIVVPMMAANGWHDRDYLPPMPMARSYPGDDVPLYRGVDKTADMLQSDADFIDAAKKLGFSRERASEISWRYGWLAMQQKDYTTAARRLNQAWLLDPSNANALDALGVVAYRRDRDVARAEELFRQSLASREPGHCANTEWGRMLLAENRPKDAIPHLVLGDDEPCRTLEVHNMLVIAYDVTDGHDAMCRYAARHKRGWDDLYLTDPVYKDAQRRVASCSVPQ